MEKQTCRTECIAFAMLECSKRLQTPLVTNVIQYIPKMISVACFCKTSQLVCAIAKSNRRYCYTRHQSVLRTDRFVFAEVIVFGKVDVVVGVVGPPVFLELRSCLIFYLLVMILLFLGLLV